MNGREAWPHCREAGVTGGVNGESCARSHDPVRPPIGKRGGTSLAWCARSLTGVAWWSPSLISDYLKALRQPFKPQPWTLLCIRRPRSGYLGPRGSGGLIQASAEIAMDPSDRRQVFQHRLPEDK
uniref:DNA repair protein SWI5 homolog isoform X2 n=1 Tax=Myodes glareolus TaxID=447135 RepID=UPI002022061E|nr:DNA repair protein SWI5 homolog isoform X2 [Myodes glareolus]